MIDALGYALQCKNYRMAALENAPEENGWENAGRTLN
jgi:hypothetical protein